MTAMLKSLRRPMARTLWGAMERERLHPPLIMRQGTAWYRYDRRLVKLNGGTTASKTLDLTGNGNTATQGTEANQFTYVQSAINGKPALQTDGNDGLVVSGGNMASTTAFTWVFAMHMVPNGSDQLPLAQNATSGTPYELRAPTSTSKASLLIRGNIGLDVSTHSQILSEGDYVIGIRFDGSLSLGNRVRISINGDAENIANDNTSVSDVGGDFLIFLTTALQPVSGTQIAELAPVAAALSDADMDAEIDYMMGRYGIS